MEQLTEASIDDYMSYINNQKATLIQNGLDKHEILCFRGQADIDYEILPAIARGRTSPSSISIFNEERNLIEEAKNELPEVFCNYLSPIELLALLQHHGIPTRLLDISYNPLVALYFACCSNSNEIKKDGEVIVFKKNERHIGNAPIHNAIADSYRYVQTSDISLELFYKGVSTESYFSEQKHIIEHKKWTGNDISNWINKCCEELMYVNSPIRIRRQAIQQGSYILFPNSIYKISDPENFYGKDMDGKLFFNTIINPIKKNSEDICLRIRIPSTLKECILENLKIYGISRKRLFSDNADIVCEEITNDFYDKIGIKKRSNL